MNGGTYELNSIFTNRYKDNDEESLDQDELAIKKFKTKFPDVWLENFKSDPNRLESLFLKFLKLNSGEMFVSCRNFFSNFNTKDINKKKHNKK